jgi:TRAP-type C4-dicarboxylate transport system permease small subunit
MLRSLYVATERTATIAARCMGYVLLLTSFLVAAEVILRKSMSFSFAGADELSGYVLIILSAWGFSFALVTRSHIRIDVVHARLPERAQAVLDVIALMAHALLAGLLLYYGYIVLADSWDIGITANTPLRTPLWIPQVLWVAGLLFFCLSILVVLARCVGALSHGQLGLVRRLAGVETTSEEAQEEVAEHATRAAPAASDRNVVGKAT